MLVLSRSENDRILFPKLGITVEVLRVQGKKVRVGVDAPPDVRIIRHELADQDAGEDKLHSTAIRKRRHDLRNRLNSACLALHLAKRQMANRMATEAEVSLENALRELESLDQQISADRPDSKQRGEARQTSTRRALIVEDNANERELLAGILRMSGYEVDCVADGLEALRYLKRRRPDAVLLDMRMPRLNGPKTVSAIRCNPDHRGLKLFAVSGSDQDELNIPVGDRGVNRWFSKPLNADLFVEQLNREVAECVPV